MKKTLVIIFLLVVLSGLFSFVVFPKTTSAQVKVEDPKFNGLIPCGRNSGTAEEMTPCTLCHLIIGFQRLVQFGLYLVTTLAFAGIFFAGVMYVVSAGDESMMTSAKNFLRAALVGFAVVLGGWLIVNVTLWAIAAKGDLGIKKESWWKFTCSTQSSSSTGSPQGVTSGPQGGGGQFRGNDTTGGW